MITFGELKKNQEIRIYIQRADESLKALGFTEHSFAHVTRVAETAGYVLETLGFPEHDIELVKMASYLHDIGNLVNRVDHSQSGAVMAFRILDHLEMPAEDIATIVTAIGNHDEGTGVPVNPIAAALILADKSDVRRNRVQEDDQKNFDIHDRVNYSVTESALKMDKEKMTITLELSIDNHYSEIGEYFQIFMPRMLLCKSAAEHLKLEFDLFINGQKLM